MFKTSIQNSKFPPARRRTLRRADIIHNSRRGFTTTELLVGIGLFTVIGSVMTGIFVSALKNQRIVQETMSVNNNSGLVLEQMAREIRTGYNFEVQEGFGECPEGFGSELMFTNGQSGAFTRFALAENQTVVRQEGAENPELELSASSVRVRRLCFRRFQFDDDVCNPERVTITMEVTPLTNASSVLPLSLETSVSSRVLQREILGNDLGCRR